MEKSHVSGTEIEDISMHSNLVMAYEDHDDSKCKLLKFNY